MSVHLIVARCVQARFTHSLLNDMAHIAIPSDRIYSTAKTRQPKSSVMAMLQKRYPGTQYHFVEAGHA